MNRKRCEAHGHKWVAYDPGGNRHCARWFCKAKAPSPGMVFIERSLHHEPPAPR